MDFRPKFGQDVKIKASSGASVGIVACILNELSGIVAGVTNNLATIYGAIATGVKLDFASSSASDTAAGTGAQAITVIGLGPGGVPKVATYATNGTTTVTTPDFWWRVFAAWVSAVGSGGVQAGTIYIVATTTG